MKNKIPSVFSTNWTTALKSIKGNYFNEYKSYTKNSITMYMIPTLFRRPFLCKEFFINTDNLFSQGEVF